MRVGISLLTFALAACTAAAGQLPPEDARTADLKARARAFVTALTKGDYAACEKTYDDAMRKALPAAKLETTWKAVVAQVGDFKKQVGTRAEKADKYDVIYVTCQFDNAALDFRIVFDSDKRVTGLQIRPAKGAVEYKPPAYVKPGSFREQEVTIGEGKWKLPGTLSMPKGDGPFPAVVLVHGSGPQDRDETIGPNKPLRDLAGGLASRGIAVLRYEKRTEHYRNRFADPKSVLTIKEEVIDDAVAAAALLRKTKGIDPKRIFVVGHSLGGMMAPRIGEADRELAGLIILAGLARPLADAIQKQFDYIESLGGLSDEKKAEIKNLRQQLQRAADPKLTADVPASELPGGSTAAYWLSLRGDSPPTVAARLKCPLLVLQGERDYNVTMEDFRLWKKALATRKDVKFKSYPALNHLFMEGPSKKATPAEFEKPGHVAAEVIEDIAAWVKR